MNSDVVKRQILRTVDNIEDFRSICCTSKWFHNFYTSKEGQDIRKKLEAKFARENSWAKENSWYSRCYWSIMNDQSMIYLPYDSLDNIDIKFEFKPFDELMIVNKGESGHMLEVGHSE